MKWTSRATRDVYAQKLRHYVRQGHSIVFKWLGWVYAANEGKNKGCDKPSRQAQCIESLAEKMASEDMSREGRWQTAVYAHDAAEVV